MTTAPSRKKPRAIRIVAALALLGGLCVAATAAALPVTGQLGLPARFSPPAVSREGRPRLFYYEERNGLLAVRARRVDAAREIAVVLLGPSEGERPRSSFRIVGGDLMPTTMVVQTGSSLLIENTDGCIHELYSDDIEGFQALQTPPGNSRPARVPQPGHYTIRDRLYEHVVGHLHVVTNLAARARMGRRGRFEFADVEPGDYTLKAFYGANEIASEAVTVPRGRRFVMRQSITVNLQR